MEDFHLLLSNLGDGLQAKKQYQSAKKKSTFSYITDTEDVAMHLNHLNSSQFRTVITYNMGNRGGK